MALSTERITELTGARVARSRRIGRLAPVDRRDLPAGPRWPAIVQTVLVVRFRHLVVPWLHHRYGDVFTVTMVPGKRPLVMLTRPEHLKEVFAGDPEVFQAGKGNSILGPVLGEHSLLIQDGEDHQRARRLLMPSFNGASLRGYQRLVTEVAADEVRGWRPGIEFASLTRMNALTLEVILRVVFGVSDERRLAALRPRVNRTVAMSPGILIGWSLPWVPDVGPFRSHLQNQRDLDQLMYAEIAERRAAPDLAERTDVLSRLIQVEEDGDSLRDPELRDQLITLLLAGHETTATALSWALWELGRDQEQLSRAQHAVDTGDGDWLEAVLKESMRIHPVIPMVMRQLARPTRVAGIDLPAGATVAPSIILTHQSEENHEQAGRFRPDRFLEKHGNRTGPPANTWIPFGGGVRRCIGAGFSLMEGVAVLREVLSRYDISATGSDGPKVRNVTSVPRRGARITVTPRRHAVLGPGRADAQPGPESALPVR